MEISENFQERPRICLVDINKDELQILKSQGFNCREGSFGSVVQLPNYNFRDVTLCLPIFDIPSNLHEYDILVIDLKDRDTIPFDESKHKRSSIKGESILFLSCTYPQNTFDPRPLVGNAFKKEIEDFQNKEAAIIIFSNKKEGILYHSVDLKPKGYQRRDPEIYHNYSFLPDAPHSINRLGRDTKVALEANQEFRNFLQRYNNKFTYNIVFEHPTRRDGQNEINDESFVPLILSADNQIVSYIDFRKKRYVFVFPQLEDKATFLLELFQSKLPALFPNLFPYSTAFAWLRDTAYRLPNQIELILEKEVLEAEYRAKIQTIDEKILDNHKEYSFLHDLLTQTGAHLVKTVENYFRWLEFEEVVNFDEVGKRQINEEDLQVFTDQGLLVVEVKGMGSTSTDNDCSQINKIKFRRIEERGKFDVFALYLTNHERYLPPKNRKLFNERQIQDAKNETRGLLTTYDLFKLYFYINAGYITKEDARKALLGYGLVTFKPSKAVSIGRPTEIFHNHTVGIFFIENIPIRLGGEVLIAQDDDYIRAKIIGIQVNDIAANEVSDGEVGLRFSSEIAKRSEIWILN